MNQAIATSGTRFGSYELVRYLAAGGMADLYLARHQRFPGRELVIKRIQNRYLDHTRVVKMFIDEGRIAKVLAHPNIVRVLDVGQHEGAYYIAMEYIHGHDLVSVCRRSVETGMRIPRAVAVGVVAQAAAGLDYAHTRRDEHEQPLQIVHCDVSPGNVVIAFRGSAKIVDFGIARATIALREEEHVAGKYNYMAPEQIRGEAVDARADLFSLGVMLWELTLGKRLYRGRPEEVMRKVLDEEAPAPVDVESGFSPVLSSIVMRLLQRDRELRYPSAGALLADLGAYLEAEETGYGKSDIARYLRTLFDAKATEQGGLAAKDTADDDDVDRGMPTTGEHEKVDPAELEDIGDTEDIEEPSDEDDFADAPLVEDKPESREEIPPVQAPLPQPDVHWLDAEPTELVSGAASVKDGKPFGAGPEWRPPRRAKFSTGVVMGGVMVLLAALLVIAYFAHDLGPVARLLGFSTAR